jgi:hypothetical protein
MMIIYYNHYYYYYYYYYCYHHHHNYYLILQSLQINTKRSNLKNRLKMGEKKKIIILMTEKPYTIVVNIRDFNTRSLAAHNRTEWMTKTFLDRITLTTQFPKGSILANHHYHHHHHH